MNINYTTGLITISILGIEPYEEVLTLARSGHFPEGSPIVANGMTPSFKHEWHFIAMRGGVRKPTEPEQYLFTGGKNFLGIKID